VKEIELLKTQETELTEKARKCRVKRENLEQELKQTTPGTRKTCDQPQNSSSGANSQKQVFDFIIGFSR